MLVLTRRKNEGIIIDGDILVTMIEIHGDKVRLGVVAPEEKPVHRGEVWECLHEPPALAILDPAWLAWNDGTVLRLARAIAEEGNYGALLPILTAVLAAGMPAVPG